MNKLTFIETTVLSILSYVNLCCVKKLPVRICGRVVQHHSILQYL